MINKGMKILIFVMILSLFIAWAWDKVSIIKTSVHFALDPLLIPLLTWNALAGVVIITFVVMLFMTLVQKYTTDQEALKNMKKETEELQKRMKELKNQPDKMMELQKKQFENWPRTMELTMKPLIYTFIPLILIFRWFQDGFNVIGNPKLFLGLGWFGTYFIFSIVFSLILRKVLKVY